MNTAYGSGTTLNIPYEEAIPRVKEALKAEGFGVLTEIDVRQILREKLATEMEPQQREGTGGGTPQWSFSRTPATWSDPVRFVGHQAYCLTA